MAELKLKTGEVVLVDDADLPLVAGKNWRLRGGKKGKEYVAYTQGTKHYQKAFYMHRIITGAPTGVLVDHRDRNPFNNRRENLRLTGYSGNGANSRPRQVSTKTSKFKGVYWNKANHKWMVRVNITYVGYFEDEMEAAKAYNVVAAKMFGEFALLNSL